jgi:hypothetical protein
MFMATIATLMATGWSLVRNQSPLSVILRRRKECIAGGSYACIVAGEDVGYDLICAGSAPWPFLNLRSPQ